MAPVPIALCGKSPTMAQSFSEAMLPEYEITHHFPSTAAVHHELPRLLNGETIKPQSGVGSNANSDDMKFPKAIVVGAGFSKAELDDMRSIHGADSLPWLYPDAMKTAVTPLAGPFIMTVIVKRAKACMKANGLEDGKASEKDPGVWYF